MKCQRCGASGAERMFLALGYAAGEREGEHVADVDRKLCPACIEMICDLMLVFMAVPCFSGKEAVP